MFATQGTALVIEIIIGVFTILSGIAFSIKWLVKHYFAEIKAEFKPNGGSSLRDSVNRLENEVSHLKDHMMREEKEQRDINLKIDRMYSVMIEFMQNNKK